MSTKYEATFPRVALGLLAGVIVGPIFMAFTIAPFLGPGFFLFPFGASDSFIKRLAGGYGASLFALPVGLVVIGAPLWGLLHALRWRSALAVATMGLVATFGGCFAFAFYLASYNNGLSRFHQSLLQEAIRSSEFAAVVAISGLATALMVWRIAYRRAAPDLPERQPKNNRAIGLRSLRNGLAAGLLVYVCFVLLDFYGPIIGGLSAAAFLRPHTILGALIAVIVISALSFLNQIRLRSIKLSSNRN